MEEKTEHDMESNISSLRFGDDITPIVENQVEIRNMDNEMEIGVIQGLGQYVLGNERTY